MVMRMTNEFSADTIIDEADMFAVEASLALATKEDQCAFIGDGTSTYGGIIGINTKLVTINGVDNGGGVVLGAGNLISEITLANLNSVVGALPEYAERNARWVMSKVMFGQCLALISAAGGNTMDMLMRGPSGRQLLGYPVELSPAFPKTDANSQILATLGDYGLAGDFGDRQGIAISSSNSASVGGESVFERDEVAVKATERMDINIHDLGTSTAAGPVVGLISAAS